MNLIDEPDLCQVFREYEEYYSGNWVEGFGFIDVKFPKETTRELTDEEIEYYNGKIYGISGVPIHRLELIKGENC